MYPGVLPERVLEEHHRGVVQEDDRVGLRERAVGTVVQQGVVEGALLDHVREELRSEGLCALLMVIWQKFWPFPRLNPIELRHGRMIGDIHLSSPSRSNFLLPLLIHGNHLLANDCSNLSPVNIETQLSTLQAHRRRSPDRG